MVSIFGFTLFTLISFYSLQRSIFLSNEELSGVALTNNKVPENKKIAILQLKSISMTSDAKLEWVRISKSGDLFDHMVHRRTNNKQVRIISSF